MTSAKIQTALRSGDLTDDRGLAPLSTAMSAALSAAVIVFALGFAVLYPSAQTAEPAEPVAMALIGP